MKCRIHVVLVCLRLAGACNQTKHQYSNNQTHVSQSGSQAVKTSVKLVAPKGAICSLRKLLVVQGSSFVLEYSRNNFSEVANVFVALSSCHRVLEPMDACGKFVLVGWLDKAMQECFQF